VAVGHIRMGPGILEGEAVQSVARRMVGQAVGFGEVAGRQVVACEGGSGRCQGRGLGQKAGEAGLSV